MTERQIQVYVPGRDVDIVDRLGRADYSYHFVMEYYLPVLRRLGAVGVAHSPAALAQSRADCQLIFAPPHAMPQHVGPRAVAVFAWEYDTIPTEEWGGEPRNDWRLPLGRTVGAITHSEFARAAVRRAVPADYPVWSVPAPVWDRFSALRDTTDRRANGSLRLTFHGWVLDTWAMGLRGTFEFSAPPFDAADQEVELSGVIYTLVANPDDGRKNWGDALSAFIFAFADNPAATLVIKLIHHDGLRAGDIVCDLIAMAAPYQCRVVVLHGFLDDENMARLIEATDYVVNSSRGEGQCLPLMEFMSAGTPAVTPDHTAMAEYADPGNAFVVQSYRERTHWPHDPRRIMRCFTYTVNWESMRDAYRESWAVITQDPGRYQRMCDAAVDSLARYCAQSVAETRLTGVLDRVAGPPAAGVDVHGQADRPASVRPPESSLSE